MRSRTAAKRCAHMLLVGLGACLVLAISPLDATMGHVARILCLGGAPLVGALFVAAYHRA